MRKFIITKGQTEALFLHRILQKEVPTNATIVDAGGYSSALSLTKSLLLDEVDKIILFLDSDVVESRQVADKRAFIDEYLSLGTRSQKIVHIIFAIPHFESFVFSIPSVVRKYFPDITDAGLTELKYNPSAYNFKNGLQNTVKDLIEGLDESDLILYRESDCIAEMIDILNGAEKNHNGLTGNKLYTI